MADKYNAYDERLYTTVDILDECPFCGCELVAVHHYDDSYEDPHEYTIEHLDEKEAVTKGCFMMYYAFGSLEDAIEKCNRRYSHGQRIIDVVNVGEGDADGRA